jgi:hypothetical protein
MPEDQDWRLRAQLHEPQQRAALERILERLHGGGVAHDAQAAVGPDVAITHDGSVLWAYAASSEALGAARRAIEQVLRDDGLTGDITVSHWDESVDDWLQVDPPLEGRAAAHEQAAERQAQTPESRTMVISSGKMIRAEVEQTMREWASKLGLDCEVIEHPHLLTAQVAFTVTGPKGKIDEFAKGLRAEELATMRSERAVMLSPL